MMFASAAGVMHDTLGQLISQCLRDVVSAAQTLQPPASGIGSALRARFALATSALDATRLDKLVAVLRCHHGRPTPV